MRKPYKYTKELLQEHISKSNSYRQLILSFGLKYPSGGSQNRFKTLIKEYGINLIDAKEKCYFKIKENEINNKYETDIHQVVPIYT